MNRDCYERKRSKSMLNTNEQKAELLQRKPERQTKHRFAPLLRLLGGIVILGALLVVAWQVYATNHASPNAGKPSPQKGRTVLVRAPWDNYPPVYGQTLRTQVA